MSRMRRRGLSVVFPATIAATIFLVSCLDDPSGPGYQPGFLALAPSFESSAAGIVDVDSIHVILVRDADGTVPIDTVIALNTDSDTVDLRFDVLVTSPNETFTLTLECLSPTGVVVFSAGPLEVTATTSGTDDVVAEDVPVTYVGPGFDAAGVRIMTADVVVDFGEAATLVVEALDSSGAVIEDTPIEWISHDSDRAVFPDRGVGQVVGGVERGWVHVEAKSLTGQADTIDVMVEPVPSAIVVASGNNQTAAQGATLRDSIVVQVNAADGPMSGVSVDFATTGDGSLSPTSATTDENGYAWTWWTLGSTAGAQTASASVADIPTVQTTITATAGNQPAGIRWIGSTDGNWSDPTRWDLGRIPTSTETVYILEQADGERVLVDVPATVAFLVLDGGFDLNVMTGQTLTIDSSASIGGDGYLTLDNGATLTGAGAISVDGTVRWEGGATVSGTDTLTINENAWLLLPSTTARVLDGKSVDNYGNLQWSDGDIVTTNGATIHNYGRFHSSAEAALLWDSVGTSPSLINEGEWDHTVAGTTDIAIDVEFREAGSLLLFHGTLRITDAIELQDTTEINVSAVAGAPYPVLVLNTTRNNFVWADASLIVGDNGTVRLEGGHLSIVGTYDQTAPGSLTEIEGGEFSMNGTVMSSLLEMSSGTIDGVTLTVTDSMYLAGGTVGAPVSIDDTAIVVIDGSVNLNDQVNNRGTVEWLSGAITTTGRGITTEADGLFIIDLATDVETDNVSIYNHGTLIKSGNAILTLTGPTEFDTFGGIIENFGTFDMQAGTIAIDDYFFHYDGAILQGDGTLDFTGFEIHTSGYFEFSGDVYPGTSPGIFHFVDSLPQDAASTFHIEIDGPTAGVGYDQIDIAGHATFNGNLEIASSYTPALGETFSVITFESRTGNFSDVTGLDLGGRLVLDTVWTATSLDLVATEAQATWTMVTAGGDHTCGLTPDGTTHCWGANWYGELGDGTTTETNLPVAVLGGINFQSISAGDSFSCGLTAAGAAYCWGGNSYGQLGDGTNTDATSPVQAIGGHTFVSLSTGGSVGCGITASGDAYCWGYNSNGQLGNGTQTNSNVPVMVSSGGPFETISVGDYSVCGVATDGAAYCWGLNTNGQLGDGTNTQSTTPVAVTGGHSISSVEVYYYHTCGIRTDGAAYCWGHNDHGQLGNGTTVDSNTPVAVSGGHSFLAASAGRSHTCALTTTGDAYCWGRGGEGQLGNLGVSDNPTPTTVLGGVVFESVDLGWHHCCGVANDGTAYCWGSGYLGQIGDGFNTDRLTPRAVIEP